MVQSQVKPEPTKLETSSKALNLPASWYIAMPAKKLKQKPQAIEIFSQPLVAFRDSQGQPVIMERFCSHMGASLALGKVKEGCIQCAYHHWEYNSKGQCVSIPETDKIPTTAGQKTYVTVERYGFIWVWYGTETPLFQLPEFPPLESQKQDYMPFRAAWKSETTIRRIEENSFDVSHFVTVHHLKNIGPIKLQLLGESDLEKQAELPIDKEAYFAAVIEYCISRYPGLVSGLVKLLQLNSEPQLFNLLQESWPSGHLTTLSINNQEKLKAISCHTPVDGNKVELYTILAVKKTGNLLMDCINYLIFGVSNWLIVQQEDVPIWNTCDSNGGRAYTKTDYEVLKFREFYQSWVDRVE